MKIEEIKVLRGPNYWSVRRPKLIQMKLDLEEMEQRPTNTIDGFLKRIQTLLPSLYEHLYSAISMRLWLLQLSVVVPN